MGINWFVSRSIVGSQEDRGIIQDVCDWGSHGYRGAVRVCWEKKNHTMECYRVGGDGKVDLRAVKVAEGNLYYPNHLPYLGLSHAAVLLLSSLMHVI